MKTCLVVDDSDVIRKVARRILEGMNLEISEAANGEEALAACRVRMPDTILLDWNMPSMNGIDFLNSLQVPADARRPIVIYCTTENDPVDIARAMAAGADEYLLKPYDRESMRAKLVEARAI